MGFDPEFQATFNVVCYCNPMLSAPEKLDPNAVALFVDVDGTLLDIRDNPADVRADATLVELLERCFEAVGGAFALVSGRSVAEVDRIFAPAVFPVAGAHGAELRIDGGEVVTCPHAPLPQGVLAPLEDLVAANHGLLLEYKRGGVSLHYRRAPRLEAACRERVRQVMGDIGDAYRLIAGKMVLEIAPRGHDKGTALELFLGKPPFAGNMPVFIGDDVTDEDGFRVVNERGGISIRVGDAEHSEARFQLRDVAAVRSWLAAATLAGAHNNKAVETSARE